METEERLKAEHVVEPDKEIQLSFCAITAGTVASISTTAHTGFFIPSVLERFLLVTPNAFVSHSRSLAIARSVKTCC